MTNRQPPVIKSPIMIDFLVVGGGVVGLSCAIALQQTGHRVVVVERDASVDDVRSLYRLFCRIELTSILFQTLERMRPVKVPPNMMKIYNNWGYGDRFIEQGIISNRLTITRCGFPIINALCDS